ncbi:MAG: hypothetical protein H0X02_05955 [Nitrosomonas sp.]|nr:hypothetical protein [Nitrosomonas sp.]
MKPRPWLEPDDEQWLQKLRWNIGRGILMDSWDNRRITRDHAGQCPLVEEAQWYLTNVPASSTTDRYEMAKLILANGRSPRHLAYAGMIGLDSDMVRDAALNGDPMAQCGLSFAPNCPEGSLYWLTKSMDSGYGDAFRETVAYFNRTGARDADRQKAYLLKGVLAASKPSIEAYINLRGVDPHEALYLAGQVWGINCFKQGSFTALVRLWYQTKPGQELDLTAAFIIGRAFHKLIGHPVERLYYGGIQETLREAHKFYLAMCENAQRAVLAWMLVGRKLKVSRDMRLVIAHHIWGSRDQPEWS